MCFDSQDGDKDFANLPHIYIRVQVHVFFARMTGSHAMLSVFTYNITSTGQKVGFTTSEHDA